MFPECCGLSCESENTEDKNILPLLPESLIDHDPNFVNFFFKARQKIFKRLQKYIDVS